MEQDDLERELETLHHASWGWALGCSGWDRQEAEDVLQTSYLKILDGRARFDGRSALKTWLFALIRRTASESRRRSFLKNLGVLKFTRQVVPLPGPDPDAAIEKAEKAPCLMAALKALPARQREILALVFYHDLTIQEAAGVVGVSVGTARTHYERGKRTLRQRLDLERTR